MRFIGFDIETADADELFTYGDGFVRIGGWMTDDGPKTTADIKGELIPALNAADWIFAHNFFGFDGLALAWHYPELINWETLAGKALDTLVLERLRFPPQARDTGGSVDKYDLDNCCARHGVGGKTDDLPTLAKLHGGYDKIPVEDLAYRKYLEGDVAAVDALFEQLPRNRYAKREHAVEAILGRWTLNGMRVDIPLLNQRLEQTEATKREAMQILGDDFGLPLGRLNWTGRKPNKVEVWEDFSSPLATQEGKEWLKGIWDAFGIVNPPLTETKQLSTKAEDMREILELRYLDPELVEILQLIMTVTTSRTVYQTVNDHLVGDRVHARINMGQASGRSSVTRPGLTVFGKKGDRYHERDIFIPDDEDSVFFTCDLSQVDMRAVAGMCGDKNYAALFEDGRDPHTEIAVRFFGSKDFREKAKPLTHGSNYGLGRKKLIEAGHDPRLVKSYFDERRTQFVRLMEWQDEVREIVKSGQLLTGAWGRKLKADRNRAYTQAPALMGQNGAAEILKECILRLPPEIARDNARMMVHDEVDFVCKRKDFEEIAHEVKKAFTWTWESPSGLEIPIECDLEGPAKSWGSVIGDKKK